MCRMIWRRVGRARRRQGGQGSEKDYRADGADDVSHDHDLQMQQRFKAERDCASKIRFGPYG